MDEKKSQSEDYITVSWFKNGIKDLFRHFFVLLSFLQFVIIKCWYFLAIGLFFGLFSGYLYYISKPTLYRVSMVVASNELTKKTYAEMLDQLNKLGTSGRDDQLSSVLQIPHSLADKVLFIDSQNMNNDPLESDTSTKTEQFFKIIVGLKDNLLSDTLQNALVAYLNNSFYLKKLKQEQTKINQGKIIFIDSELRKLDSLKLSYNKFLSTPNMSATFYNNAFNPADLFVQSKTLADQKDLILRWLALNTTSVSIVDGFKTTVFPQSISLRGSMLILGGSGFLIGFIIGLMIETKKKVNA